MRFQASHSDRRNTIGKRQIAVRSAARLWDAALSYPAEGRRRPFPALPSVAVP